MAFGEMTPEQRLQAQEARKRINELRGTLRKAIKDGTVTFEDVVPHPDSTDPRWTRASQDEFAPAASVVELLGGDADEVVTVLRKTKVSYLLASVKGLGAVGIEEIFEESGVAPDRKINGLTAKQAIALYPHLPEAQRPAFTAALADEAVDSEPEEDVEVEEAEPENEETEDADETAEPGVIETDDDGNPISYNGEAVALDAENYLYYVETETYVERNGEYVQV